MRHADVVIALIGASGECTREQLKMVAGDRYVEKILTGLKRKGLIKRKVKDGLTGYRLTRKGYAQYTGLCGPPAIDFPTVSKQVGRKKRLRLHRNAWGIVVCYLAGVPISFQYPFEERRFGYYPVSFYQKKMNDDVKSSRMSGFLICQRGIYLVYDMLGQDMVWRRSVEERAARSHSLEYVQGGAVMDTDAIFLTDSMEVANKLLNRWQGYCNGRLGPESFFEHMYFYPHTREGIRELWFLLEVEWISPLEEQLRELIVSPAGEYAVMEGTDEAGWEFYFCFYLELKKLKRMEMEIEDGNGCRIFTMSFFSEFYRTRFPKAEIIAFDEDKIRNHGSFKEG